MKTITGTTKAWLTPYHGPENLNEKDAVSIISYSDHDMTTAGWVYVGVATISVEAVGDAELIDNKVAALRGELQTLRAQTEMKSNDLEAKIQKLLAIEFTQEVAA